MFDTWLPFSKNAPVPTGSAVSRCPTGRPGFLFPLIGLVALIWALIRVVPKPSRAGYPCVKVASLLASAFIVYISGHATSAFAIHRARQHFRNARYAAAGSFVVLGVLGSLWMNSAPDRPAYANAVLEAPNSPRGEARGVYPERVVWVWDPDATNGDIELEESGEAWWMPRNNDQEVIDRMLSDGLRSLTGEFSDAGAWDAIFRLKCAPELETTHCAAPVAVLKHPLTKTTLSPECEHEIRTRREGTTWSTYLYLRPCSTRLTVISGPVFFWPTEAWFLIVSRVCGSRPPSETVCLQTLSQPGGLA